MFSPGHLLWIGISAVLIIAGFLACRFLRPSVEKLLKICLFIGVISEAVKVLYLVDILPVVEPTIQTGGAGAELAYIATGQYVPYLEIAHLPIELCSLMIVFMAAALLAQSEIWKKRLQSLIYVTGLIGGTLGIVFAYVTADFTTISAYFSSIRVWQFFLYHSMIMTLGLYLGFRKGSEVSRKSLKSTLGLLLILDIPTFYINSVFSQPVYTNGKPTGLVYWANFFSSYVNPLGIVLTEKWQWLVYLVIRLILVVAAVSFLLWIAGGTRGDVKSHDR